MTETFTNAVAAVIFAIVGWVYAHETVARECEKLGSFYVNDAVYECHRKEPQDGR